MDPFSGSLGYWDVAINNSGVAVGVLLRDTGGNRLIESHYSQDGGATWSALQIIPTQGPPQGDAEYAKVAINNNNRAIAIWIRDNGVPFSNEIT